MEKALNRLIPETIKNDLSLHFSAKMIVYFSVVLFVVSLLYIVRFLDLGFEEGALGSVGTAILAFIFPVILKKTESVPLTANLYTLLICSFLYFSIFHTGGFHSVVLLWMALIPLIAVILAGSRSGWFWGLIALVIVLLTAWLEFDGDFHFPQTIVPTKEQTQDLIVSNAIFVILLTLLGQIFSKSKENSFNAFLKSQAKTEEIAGNLQKVIKEVADTSRELRQTAGQSDDASKEMQVASTEIAESTDREAQNLQEVQHNVEQLVVLFNEIANRAKDIQQHSNESQKSAARGVEAAEKTNQTMKQIEDSSRKIAGIVNVITDIANQTNLLSLNAAIEAAKAGELGKGFAVVADEVRNLAEKSSVSVTEIQKLVDFSNHNVQKGNSVIKDTAVILNEIISEIGDISQQINTITETILKQNVMIASINNAVKSISSGSETTAAAAEQLSATARLAAKSNQELHSLAERLSEKVAEYHQ
ncbi:methyl-accepting chemotaxis protein [Deltaproteobacteria bacterium TL4]